MSNLHTATLDTEDRLTPDQIRGMIRPTLERMETHEADTAEAWIAEFVDNAPDIEVQQTLIEDWFSVYDRLRWSQMYGGNN